MGSVKFIWDTSAAKALGKLDAEIASVARKAGSSALRAMRADAKRRVRDRAKIKAGYLAAKSLPLFYARGRKLGDLVWTMAVSGKEVPLGEFPSRQLKAGVLVEVLRGQRKLIKSAFIADRKDGSKGVFLRRTDKRYPMGHRLGPNVPNVMEGDDKLIPDVLARGGEVFRSTFERLFGK